MLYFMKAVLLVKTWRRIATIATVALIVGSLLLTPLCNNKLVVIVSGSMEPVIHTNALALVHFCDLDSVNVGDIIVYYHPGYDELITHRVVVKGEDYVWTQGDANSIADDIAVVEDNLYGKVLYVANWAVPIMEGFVSDRQFDRGSMITALFVLAIIIAAVIFGLAWCIVQGLAWAFVLKKSKYKVDELERMSATYQRLLSICQDPTSLTLRQQKNLRLAYRVWRRDADDMDDELNKIQGGKSSDSSS